MTEYVNPRAQACQNCVKAKAKCYNHADGKCERCNRLGRDCAMQASAMRKRKAVKTNRGDQAERIAELELKLKDLASRIVSSRPSPICGESPSFVVMPDSTSIQSDGTNSTPHLLSHRQPSIAWQFTPSTLPRGATGVPVDAEELLNIFRRDLARQVPFISLPEQATVHSLSKERPFLFQAIITVVSYHDSVYQSALGQEFLRYLTEHLILQAQKNLDMLQGLLVYISWYNGMLVGRSQITTLLTMAFSLVVDLHLYFPMTSFENHDKFLNEMKGIISAYQVTWTRKSEPSREEKRAILGCFYLFSTTSAIFCRINPLRWTPYMQHCHDEILNHPENEGDIYLAHLSALQRIAMNIRHSDLQECSSQPRSWNAAAGVHVKLVMSELQRFQASLPENLQQDPLLLMHYNSVEMNVYEICFSMPPTIPADTPTLQRADALVACLKATRAITDVYLSISVDSIAYLNFRSVFMAQIYLALATLSKLAVFRAEDWEVNNVETTLYVFTILDRVIQMTDDASARYDLRDDDKPWLQISQRMRQLKIGFERLLANENTLLASTIQVEKEGDGAANTYMPLLWSQFDLLGNEFWQGFPDDNDLMH